MDERDPEGRGSRSAKNKCPRHRQKFHRGKDAALEESSSINTIRNTYHYDLHCASGAHHHTIPYDRQKGRDTRRELGSTTVITLQDEKHHQIGRTSQYLANNCTAPQGKINVRGGDSMPLQGMRYEVHVLRIYHAVEGLILNLALFI